MRFSPVVFRDDGINIVTVGVDQHKTQWAVRRRPVRSTEPMAGVPSERPRYSKFAAAMAAARAANAPQLAPLGDGHDIQPVVGRDLRRPVAAPWQAERAGRRPVARWLGIGSCALVLGLLLVTVPLLPLGPEIERPTGLWHEWQKEPAPAAAPQADRALPAAPQPAAGHSEPRPGSTPSAGGEVGAAAEPEPATPVVALAAPAAAAPAARSVPVPALKPRRTHQ